MEENLDELSVDDVKKVEEDIIEDEDVIVPEEDVDELDVDEVEEET